MAMILANPSTGLMADANGNLFGTTPLGGTYGDGTLFELVNTGTVAAPSYASTPTTLIAGAPKIQWIKQADGLGGALVIMSPRQTAAPSLYGRFFEIEFRNLSHFRHGDETLPRRRLYSDPLLRSAVILKRRALHGTFCPKISMRRSNSSIWRHWKNGLGAKSGYCLNKVNGNKMPKPLTVLKPGLLRPVACRLESAKAIGNS